MDVTSVKFLLTFLIQSIGEPWGWNNTVVEAVELEGIVILEDYVRQHFLCSTTRPH